MKSKPVNGKFVRKIPRLNVYLAYFAVIIMITITWYSAVQEAMAVQGRPSGPISYVAYRIQADDNEVQEGVNLTIKGSVLIESGGRLTIRNSIVTIDSASDGLERIELMTGGELIIENSTLKANATGLRYRFMVRGTMFMNGSTIQDIYGDGKVGGIEIYSTFPVEIRNTTVMNAKTSAIYVQSGTPLFDNLTIKNSVYGLYIYTPSGSLSDPTANFTISGDSIIRTGQTFSFDGTASLGTIRQFFWDFGDGETATGSMASHAYSAPGIFKVSLTVTDTNGRMNKLTKTLQVLSDKPSVTATASPYNASRNESITFFGDKSTDLDGQIMEYKWSFDDGAMLYGSIVKHKFATSGSHVAILAVTDDTGVMNNNSLTVEISNNIAPVANAGHDMVAFVNHTTPFDATGSSDPDGSISRYIWDFGDGAAPQSGSTVTHKYNRTGIFVATLTVADNSDALGDDTCVVVVKDAYWPELKYDRNRQAASEDAGPQDASTVITRSLAAPSSIPRDSGAVIGNEMVYVGSGSVIAAYDVNDLTPKWSYNAGANNYFVTTPALSEDKLFTVITRSDNSVMLYAFDATPAIDNIDEGVTDPAGSGYDVLWYWSILTPNKFYTGASPSVYAGFVFLPLRYSTNTMTVYAFDVDGTIDGNDGQMYDPATQKYDIKQVLSSDYIRGDAVSTLAISNNMMVIPIQNIGGSVTSSLMVMELGRYPISGPNWTYYSGSGDPLTPSIEDDRVAVAFTNGTTIVFDLDPRDGVDEGLNDSHQTYDIITKYTFQNKISFYGSIILKNDMVYLSGVEYPGQTDPYGSLVYAFNITNGFNVTWIHNLTSSRWSSSDTALASDIIYIPIFNNSISAGEVVALNITNGNRVFQRSFSGNLLGALSVAGAGLFIHESLFSGSPFSNLYRIDRTSAIPETLDYSVLNMNTVIGETGIVTGVTHLYKTVQFEHYYNDPVVIAQPLSYTNSDPCHIRITNVNKTNFTMFVEEWAYLDRIHSQGETVAYIVMEKGRHYLPGEGIVDAGKVSVNDSWKSVSFWSMLPRTPVVLSQSLSYNNGDPIVTRVRNIDTTHFETKVQEEENKVAGGHPYETVGYIAWTPMKGSDNGIKFEAVRTGSLDCDNWCTLNFLSQFSTSPLFLGAMQTTNEDDTAGVRYKQLTATSVNVTIEEEQSLDPEMTHANEVLGYLAFANSSDIIDQMSVSAYMQQTENSDQFTFYPDFNQSMFLASSLLQDWRLGSGSSSILQAQSDLRNATVFMAEYSYLNAMSSVRSAVNNLIGLGNCLETSECKYALWIIGNASKNESFEKTDLANYTVGEGDSNVILAWQNYALGVSYLESGQYSLSMDKFYNAVNYSLQALEISKCDLRLQMDTFTFSKFNVKLNEKVYFNATVTNIDLGKSPTNNSVKLRFYIGDPANNMSTKIGTDITVPALTYLATFKGGVNHTFTHIGTYYIYAIVDQNNTANESNEDNNVVHKALTVTDGSPFPKMKYLKIQNNTIGIVVDGTPQIDGYPLTLENSTIANSTQYDVHVNNSAYLKTLDSYYMRTRVRVSDTSTLDKFFSFNLWVRNSDRTAAGGASVAYTPLGGSNTTGTADSIGLYRAQLREYTNTTTGTFYSTPHLVEVLGASNSKGYLMVDGPRTITIYKGHDADYDGYADSKELPSDRKDNVWIDAENHFWDKSQLVSDFNAFPLGPNGTALKPLSNGTIVNQDTFMNNFLPGNYFVYVRARYQTSTNAPAAKIDISAKGSTTNTTTFTLTQDYKWYHVARVILNSQGTIKLEINKNTATGDAQIRVDRIMFQRWKNGTTDVVRAGQASDTFESDVDWDRAPDGLEIRSTSYWYEAEDFMVLPNNAIIQDSTNASNSKEVRPANSNINFVAVPVSISSTTTYIIYVKAKGLQSAKLTVKVDAINGPTFTLSSMYKWFKYETSLSAGNHVIYLFCPDGTYYFARVDTLHLDRKDTTYIDAIRNSGNSTVSSFTIQDGSDGTYYFRVPEKTYIMNATIDLTQNGGWRTWNFPNSGEKYVAIDGDFIVYWGAGAPNNGLWVINWTEDSNGNGRPNIFETGQTVTPHQIYNSSIARPASISGRYVVVQDTLSLVLLDLLSDQDKDGVPDWKDNNKKPKTYSLDSSGTSNPDISGTNVVWQKSNKIYWYDISRGLTTINKINISTPIYNVNYLNPRVSGDNVVYESIRGLYLTSLNTWGNGFENPQGNTNRSLQNKLVTRFIPNPTSPAGKYELPDIDGNYVVFKYTLNSTGATQCQLIDLNQFGISSTPPIYQLSSKCNRAGPRVSGDKVAWIEDGTWIKIVDLADDPNDNGIPDYLESGRMSYVTKAVGSGTNMNYPNVNGDFIVWNDTTRGKISRSYFGIDVGGSTFSYNSQDFECKRSTTSKLNTKNLMAAMNDYIMSHSGSGGYLTVPLTFHTEFGVAVTVTILKVQVYAGFTTDPLNNDTDSDSLSDGDELQGFFGIGVIETEDAIFAKEWKNPFIDYVTTYKPKTKDPTFITQTGVTLTSSYNLVGTENNRSSYITIPWRAPSTGTYKISVWPNEGVSRVADVIWFPRYKCPYGTATGGCSGVISGYYPVNLQGHDVQGLGLATGYLQSIIENATYIEIKPAAGKTLTPISKVLTGSIEKVENGTLIGSGEGSGKGNVEFHLAYEGKYEFIKNTNYQITVGLDTSRLSYNQLNPRNSMFTQLGMVRILDLDYFRVERQVLDPMNPDTDADNLPDGYEATDTGFPLTNDADKDGLSDYSELMTSHTNPMRRDSDLDGIRDGVELGKTRAQLIQTSVYSFGSWTERIARYGTPFDYRWINNWDTNTLSTTNPNDPDSDDDGLPDGWVDGWTYKSSPVDSSTTKTYQDALNLQRTELRYDPARWGQSGEMNNVVEVYEGEDLTCDGGHNGTTKWDFTEDSTERYDLAGFKETYANLSDTDRDSVPDGYEVWFSSRYEPKHFSGNPLFSPLINDGSFDTDRIPTTSPEQPLQTTIQQQMGLNDVPRGGVVVALGQRMWFGMDNPVPPQKPSVFGPDPRGIKQIQVYLNMSLDTDSKVTMEVWDTRVDTKDGRTGQPPATPTPDMKPLAKGIEAVGYSDGWYTFDIPDNVFNPAYGEAPNGFMTWNYYLILRYVPNNQHPVGWYGGTPADPNMSPNSYDSFYQLSNGNWYPDATKVLYRIRFVQDTDIGDGASLLEEYIAGTNPKNPNTDNITIGSLDKKGTLNDHLKDGAELGTKDATGIKGGIIFRTNVASGAIVGSGYTGSGSQWIDYDPDSAEGDVWWTINFSGAGKTIDPYSDDECVNSENDLILTLEDGTQIYQRPDGDKANHQVTSTLYVFPGGLNRDKKYYDDDGRVRINTTMLKFTEVSVTNGTGSLAEAYVKNQLAYRNKILFLGDPNDPDTDDDGIPDGLETQRNATQYNLVITRQNFDINGWKRNSEQNFPDLVYDDGIINARDSDSDNDGLLDSQEMPFFLDPNSKGWVAMANPDSDGDGVLDGKEVQPSTDTDKDGRTKTAYLCYDCTGQPTGFEYDFKVMFNTGWNVFDKDSDGDLVSDGAELNPFMLIDNVVNPNQRIIYSNAVFLNDISSVASIAVAQNRDIYMASGKSLKVLQNYDKFNRSENNEARLLYTADKNINDVAVYGTNYVYFILENSKTVYQFSISSGALTNKKYEMQNNIAAIAVDKNGYVYASVDKDIYKVDFIPDAPTSTKLFTCGGACVSITDVAVDQNKNIIFLQNSGSTKSVFILKDPYTSSIEIARNTLTLRGLGIDQSGGIYYVVVHTTPNTYNDVRYLSSDYTTSWVKNFYLEKLVYKLKDIQALGVGSQYDMVLSDNDNISLVGFIGSKSSPIKRDSDNDGLIDGPDGEIKTRFFTVNHQDNSSTLLTCPYTYPTIADSDGDGVNDGTEVAGYTIKIRNMTATITTGTILSDPSRPDSDGDGLNDRIERSFSNASERDTDQDGLDDAIEDKNKNGVVELGETSPVNLDSDGDWLADGWNDTGADGIFFTHDTGEMDGIHESYEKRGEDFNNNTIYDTNEPNPTIRDSDMDTIPDGIEVQYLEKKGLRYDHDADKDGIPDVLETDADADGLRDNIENNNGDINLNGATETNPYNADTDGDYLADGAEPSPFKDIDQDGKINANDTDSNNPTSETHPDYDGSVIVFRTTANDTNGDGLLEYTTGTKIATFKELTPTLNSNIFAYSYTNELDSLPAGSKLLEVNYSGGADNRATVQTPDNRNVYIKLVDSSYEIYVMINATCYRRYTEGGSGISLNKHVAQVTSSWSHSNEVVQHRITIDWRIAISEDVDFDGLNNSMDPNSLDRDTDNDGIIDGLDPNPSAPDADGDGLPDGLEMGVQNPIPTCYVGTTLLNGTNTVQEFNWTFINGKTVRVHNYTNDMDPSTRTDPKIADSDGDGLKDGQEEADISKLNSMGTPVLSALDLNGKFDGGNETNPLDKDTDNDGLVDGWIDFNKNGLREGKEGEDLLCNGLRDPYEPSPTKFDSDSDGLGDGLERGLTLADITKDTNTDVFKLDADPTTTTDPTNIDSDGDGVPDGWVDGWTCNPSMNPDFGKYSVPDGEFQFGEGEDKNLNGKVDPTETKANMTGSKDSDNDGLLDGWDLIGTNGLYSGIFSRPYEGGGGKYRFWGELNFSTHDLAVSGSAVYQSAQTDPTTNDSDGDGLIDGYISGKVCELETNHNGISQTRYTDPSLMDSDEDGLSDGLEVSGWEVHIILEKTKKEVSNRTVYSNPTLVDGDTDDINDYDEFLNSSDPWSEDTDGDHILDGEETVGELTQIDGKDPEILKFDDGSQVHLDAVWHFDGIIPFIPSGITLDASVRVRDNAGIDYVKIKITGQKAQTKYLTNTPRESIVTISFDFNWMQSLTSGYDVNITVVDVNGNGNCTETHVDGLAEGLVKALIGAWNSFVEAVKKIVSEMYNWLISQFTALIEKAFKPILDLLTGFIDKIAEIIAELCAPFPLNENQGRIVNWSADAVTWEDSQNLKYKFLSELTLFMMALFPAILAWRAAEYGCNCIPGAGWGLYAVICIVAGAFIIGAVAVGYCTFKIESSDINSNKTRNETAVNNAADVESSIYSGLLALCQYLFFDIGMGDSIDKGMKVLFNTPEGKKTSSLLTIVRNIMLLLVIPAIEGIILFLDLTEAQALRYTLVIKLLMFMYIGVTTGTACFDLSIAMAQMPVVPPCSWITAGLTYAMGGFTVILAAVEITSLMIQAVKMK